jgi:3-hydroxyisobutyrate dehydrogenase
MKIGVLGLGKMGSGMAANLAGKAFEVVGFDLNAAACERASKHGVTPVESLAELANAVDVLIISLPKAEHVEDACLGPDGIADRARAGLIVVDATTSTPETSRKVAAALAERSIDFIDAPVSGGPSGASTGTMLMVIGGDEAVIERLAPVLDAMARTRVHMGGVGNGNVAKIANNLLTATHLIMTAEAVSLAAHDGVSPEKLIQALNAGSGGSAVTQASFPKWILSKTFDSGFTMGLMRKDLGLAQQLADDLGRPIPLGRQIIEQWQKCRSQLTDAEDFNRIVQAVDRDLFE